MFSDGLAIGADDDILYVAENNAHRVSAWQMSTDGDNGAVSASPLGYILHPDYDDPATCDLAGDIIYCVNARFTSVSLSADDEGDLDTFMETFQLIGTNRLEFSTLTPTTSPTTSPTMAPPTSSPVSAPTTSPAATTSIAVASLVAIACAAMLMF